MHAGPGRMRLRVDVELEHRAGLAIGRACLVRGPVRHFDGDLMIVRVDFFLHRAAPRNKGRCIAEVARDGKASAVLRDARNKDKPRRTQSAQRSTAWPPFSLRSSASFAVKFLNVVP